MSNQSLVNRVNRLFAVVEQRENAGSTPQWALDHAREKVEESLTYQRSLEGRQAIRKSNDFWISMGAKVLRRYVVDMTRDEIEERIRENAEYIASRFNNLEDCVFEETRWDRQWAENRRHLQEAIEREKARKAALKKELPKNEQVVPSSNSAHLAEPARPPAIQQAQGLPPGPAWSEPAWLEPEEDYDD